MEGLYEADSSLAAPKLLLILLCSCATGHATRHRGAWQARDFDAAALEEDEGKRAFLGSLLLTCVLYFCCCTWTSQEEPLIPAGSTLLRPLARAQLFALRNRADCVRARRRVVGHDDRPQAVLSGGLLSCTRLASTQ
jgi:hypothetical protein